jgi:hypothetical protein
MKGDAGEARKDRLPQPQFYISRLGAFLVYLPVYYSPSSPPALMSNEPSPDDNARKISSGLEQWEQEEGRRRPAFILNWPEVKLLGITGVGFFLDGEPDQFQSSNSTSQWVSPCVVDCPI